MSEVLRTALPAYIGYRLVREVSTSKKKLKTVKIPLQNDIGNFLKLAQRQLHRTPRRVTCYKERSVFLLQIHLQIVCVLSVSGLAFGLKPMLRPKKYLKPD